MALLASASILTLALTSGAMARGGGHFGGGHFGGGHFGGGREFHREFRPEHRIDRPHFEDRERRMEHFDPRRQDDHRALDDHRDHRDDHRPDRDFSRDHDLRHPDATRLGDLRHPNLPGRWDRNAFFGHQFAAHDFHCRAGCRWGWAGAVFWPFALGDIFSFAWWPYYGQPAFWNYGVDVILTGLFWPEGAYAWPDNTYGAYAWTGEGGQYQVARESRQDLYSVGPQDDPASSQASTSGAGSIETCAGFGPGVSVLPIDQIKSTVKPTGRQDSAFDALKAASAKAEQILKASCPSDPPLTPVGRLDALEKRLDGMKSAIETVQEPLVAFSSTLTRDQQKALDSLGGTEGAPSSDSQIGAVINCSADGQEFNGLPSQRIASAVRPDDQQKAELTKLEMVTEQQAEWLRRQCPGAVPETAQSRLEAMKQRIEETIAAVDKVRPTMVSFYNSLSDEQKAHFNTLPAQEATEQQ